MNSLEDTKTVFLNNFFDDAMSKELRNKISIFFQHNTEAFKDFRVRFRLYLMDCPHCDFSDVQLSGIFFRGLD